MSGFAPLLWTAARLGRARFVELELFEVLGSRALRAGDPAAMLFLAGSARAHAWRALQLEELLPVSLGLPGVEELTKAPDQALGEALSALGDVEEELRLLDALGASLYPAMLAAYRGWLSSLDLAGDAPVARVLRRVIGDLEAIADELFVLRPEPDPTAVPARALGATLEASDGVLGAPR